MKIYDTTKAKEEFGAYSFESNGDDFGYTQLISNGVAETVSTMDVVSSTAESNGTTYNHAVESMHAIGGFNYGGYTYSFQQTYAQTNEVSTKITAENTDNPDTITTTTTTFSATTDSSITAYDTFDVVSSWNGTEATFNTVNINVTSSVSTSTTVYAVGSGSDGKSQLTTATSSLSALTNRDSDGNPFTRTMTVGTWQYSVISSTIDAPIEVGVVIEAEGEWLWSYANTDGADPVAKFVTAIAGSFTAATFWPAYISRATIYSDFPSSRETFTNPGNEDTVTAEYISVTDTTTTSTVGDFFPRSITSTTVNSFSIDTTSYTRGFSSYTYEAFAIDVFETTTTVTADTTVYTSIPLGLDGVFSTSLLSFTTASTTTMATFEPIFGQGAETYLVNVGIRATDINAMGGATQFNPVSPLGAFISPTELKSGGNLDRLGQNLRIAGATIYYPFTDSVYNDARTPIENPFTRTAVDSDNVTWKYTWDGPTLNYKKIDTHSMTTSSGVFSTLSAAVDSVDFVTNGGAGFGGYMPISSKSATLHFGPKAVLGTSFNTDGDSSTYQTIIYSWGSSALKGTLKVEQNLPALATSQAEGGGSPYLNFPRNKQG